MPNHDNVNNILVLKMWLLPPLTQTPRTFYSLYLYLFDLSLGNYLLSFNVLIIIVYTFLIYIFILYNWFQDITIVITLFPVTNEGVLFMMYPQVNTSKYCQVSANSATYVKWALSNSSMRIGKLWIQADGWILYEKLLINLIGRITLGNLSVF